MEFIRRIFIASLWLTCCHVTTVQNAGDVCEGPFTRFLQCMAKDTDKQIENYGREVSTDVQARIQQCFTKANCQAPNFRQATVDFFVGEPYKSRLNAILDLLENMDPSVKRCMTEYFKGVIGKDLQDCVHKYGDKDVKNFRMPQIPGGDNVDITKMKTVIMNRMMIQYQLSDCAAKFGNQQVIPIIQCVKSSRQGFDETAMCLARDGCVRSEIQDAKCSNRFKKVQQAACQCVDSPEGRKDIGNDFKNTILNGAAEKKFKQCHDQNGVPYPKAKVDAAKKAARDTFFEAMGNHGQLPSALSQALRIAKSTLKEMADQWKEAFCEDCASGSDINGLTGDANADALRQLAQNSQGQLAPSPFIARNQFQPNPGAFANLPQQSGFANVPQQTQVANIPQQPVASNGGFVLPPPLPVQAAQQVPFQAAPVQSVPGAAQPNFNDFKSRLAQTFGQTG